MLRVLVPALAFLLMSDVSMADSGGTEMKGMHPSGDSKGSGNMGGMKMPMSHEPAHFKVPAEAHTTNHAFLIKMVSLPDPIPYQRHFTLSFSVYDGKHPDRKLPNATVHVTAGMRHGMKTGFAHGMQSTPRVESKDGIVTVSGLYFHMMGKWTLQVDVRNGAEGGTAYLDLPCCAQ